MLDHVVHLNDSGKMVVPLFFLSLFGMDNYDQMYLMEMLLKLSESIYELTPNVE